MFLKSKKRKELNEEDCKIVIYSTKHFLDTFSRYISIYSAKADAEDILSSEKESNRINSLIKKFDEIAQAALVDTLIITGYKREDKKKWKLRNLFS